MLRDIDALVPGSAERSLALFEDQSRHRMVLEKRVVTWDIVQSVLGLIAATIIALAPIGGGVYIAASGYSVAGIAAIITALGALAGTFVYGTKSRKEERTQKARRQNELRDPSRRQ